MTELAPIEIDPRPCELCGLTIDHHDMVDAGEGPEFFCREVDDLVKQWELDDPRDRWKHTGEQAPSAAVRNSDIGGQSEQTIRPYRTAQSTINAFLYVLGLGDVDYLTGWLARHPMDAQTLHKIWEGRNARS